jgi:actin-like ATPase involved in cell morphogenesis
MRLVCEAGVDEPTLDKDGFPSLRFVTIPDRLLSEEVRIPAGLLQQAIEPVVERIIETAHSLFIENPTLKNELRSANSGIHLSGGGALIPGFQSRLARALDLPVKVVRHPLDGVVLGARHILPIADKFDLWQRGSRSN